MSLNNAGKEYYYCVARRACIFLCEWPVFNYIVLCLVLINGVLIAMIDQLVNYRLACTTAQILTQLLVQKHKY